MPLAAEHENPRGLRFLSRPRLAALERQLLAPLVLAAILSTTGCLNWIPTTVVQPDAAFAPSPIVVNNPILLANQDPELVFETVVDVLDDYFKIKDEIPIRLEGGVLVEGEVETFPRSGSTILEPWSRDAANFYERLEGTLQSIRRLAIVRVIPAEGGFLVDLAVIKELEDVLRPETGSASRAANLRNDNSLRRYIDPVTGTQPTVGWIGLGRDVGLEQKILVQLASRFGPVVALPPAGMSLPGTMPPPGSMPPPGVILPPDWIAPPQGTAIPPGGFSGSTEAAPSNSAPAGTSPMELPPPPGTAF